MKVERYQRVNECQPAMLGYIDGATFWLDRMRESLCPPMRVQIAGAPLSEPVGGQSVCASGEVVVASSDGDDDGEDPDPEPERHSSLQISPSAPSLPSAGQSCLSESSQKIPLIIIRRKQVEARTGLSRSSLYAKIKNGEFPKPINLGGRSVGWLESSVDNWIESRITATLAQ